MITEIPVAINGKEALVNFKCDSGWVPTGVPAGGIYIDEISVSDLRRPSKWSLIRDWFKETFLPVEHDYWPTVYG